MEKRRIKQKKVFLIEDDQEIYVPVKLFCENWGLHFDSTMLYFNNFKINVEHFYKMESEKEYLCFKTSDFVKFILIIEDMNKDVKMYADKLCTSIVNQNFKITPERKIISMDIIDELVRKPINGDETTFVTATFIYNMLNDDVKCHINTQNVGRYMTISGFKKVKKRINKKVESCYEVVLLSL